MVTAKRVHMESDVRAARFRRIHALAVPNRAQGAGVVVQVARVDRGNRELSVCLLTYRRRRNVREQSGQSSSVCIRGWNREQVAGLERLIKETRVVIGIPGREGMLSEQVSRLLRIEG